MRWTSEPHVLTVPEDPTDYLDVEHPPTCAQFLETEPIWTDDDTYACQVEAHLADTGVDHWFHRAGEQRESYSVELAAGQYEIASYVETRRVAYNTVEHEFGLALYDGPPFDEDELDFVEADCQ